MFKTKVTSQGTISLPAPLRKKYNLKKGDVLTLEDNGKIIISKNPDIAAIREKNKSRLKGQPLHYQTGDGFSAHVQEKYGKK